jgi:hypothetical protein
MGIPNRGGMPQIQCPEGDSGGEERGKGQRSELRVGRSRVSWIWRVRGTGEGIEEWVRVRGCRISRFRASPPTKCQKSRAARRFPSAGDFCERACVRFDGFRNSLAINKLSFAATDDQSGVAQNLQMMRNGGGGYATHRDNLAAVHMLTAGNGLENPEARLVGQGFRYFFNPGAVHKSYQSVADLACSSP